MSRIIIPGERDPIKRGKDCPDFVPLKDGTLTGDGKYCDLSFQCKQIGFWSEYVQIKDPQTLKLLEQDYLCRGVYADKEIIKAKVDEEAD